MFEKTEAKKKKIISQNLKTIQYNTLQKLEPHISKMKKSHFSCITYNLLKRKDSKDEFSKELRKI